MKLDRIIIGTSQWGSKIDYNKSIKIGNELVKFGINNFDTAPNYGLGYAHKILNNLNTNGKIIVNTKIGQRMKLNFKELLLRLYRFNGVNSFIRSNRYLFKYSLINKKSFWKISNLEKEYELFKETLTNCDKQIFFLHSPPKEILTPDYLKIFKKFCDDNKLIPGLTSVDDVSLNSLINKMQGFCFQLSLNQYFRFENKIQNQLQKIYINKIFKNSLDQKKITKENYLKSVFEYFDDKTHVKLILGINSYNSLQKLINNL